jgi:hypothetical protein
MKREVQQQKSEQYVTISVFEKAVRAIGGRFDRIDRILETILQELKQNREEHEYFRSTFRMHDAEIVMHDRKIDGLTDRVEVLEVKRR